MLRIRRRVLPRGEKSKNECCQTWSSSINDSSSTSPCTSFFYTCVSYPPSQRFVLLNLEKFIFPFQYILSCGICFISPPKIALESRIDQCAKNTLKSSKQRLTCGSCGNKWWGVALVDVELMIERIKRGGRKNYDAYQVIVCKICIDGIAWHVIGIDVLLFHKLFDEIGRWIRECVIKRIYLRWGICDYHFSVCIIAPCVYMTRLRERTECDIGVAKNDMMRSAQNRLNIGIVHIEVCSMVMVIMHVYMVWLESTLSHTLRPEICLEPE